MEGIILSAGLGSRLGILTREEPKALLEVCGKKLIDYGLEFLDDERVSKVWVIGGYRYGRLEGYLLEKKVRGEIEKLSIIENSDYLEGSIVTLSCVMGEVGGGFILMNADHIYPLGIREEVLEVSRGIVVVCDFGRVLSEDDMKVKVERGRLIDIGKGIRDYNGGYIGMTVCGEDKLGLYEGVMRYLLGVNRGLNVESILKELIRLGVVVGVLDIGREEWFEIDNEGDKLNCERILKGRGGFKFKR